MKDSPIYTICMDDKILAAFIDAANHIFKEIGFQNITVSDGDFAKSKPQIISSVGIAGDLQGYIMLRSDLASAMNFVNKMLSNMGVESDEDDFGEFHKEAIGEIVNQVAGRAVMILEELEQDCEITPPAILTGEDLYFNVQNIDVSIYKEFASEFGLIGLFVGLKK